MTSPYDLVIIGAGPAGMSAAVTARVCGLSVALVDEASAPGGQIYRSIEAVSERQQVLLDILGKDYAAGAALAAAFAKSGSDYFTGTAVWRVDKGGQVGCSDGRTAKLLHGHHVLVATGAYERPVPMPGWVLPGVMTAGSAQILMKSAAFVPRGPILLAGAGPLLLLAASQLLAAGGDVVALVETTGMSDYLRALPSLPGAVRASEYLRKGIRMRRAIRQAGVPIISGAFGLAVQGKEHARALAFQTRSGRHEISAGTILLHQGVIPNVQITRQLECEHAWDKRGRYWRPVLDAWGRSSIDKIFVAGDATGIVGALASSATGHLAALEIASSAGRIERAERDRQAQPYLRERRHHLAIRAFLDRLFAPPEEILRPTDNATVVCRCEETTVGEIRQAVRMGGHGPNQLKAYTRCGMGPCQGRMCGLTVSEIIAEELNSPVSSIGYYRIRPPIKPISLNELASMAE
jgi:NADPH-dependent 2,4-dienoyl-CoA reductase/sulfur reductase-like enzyme